MLGFRGGIPERKVTKMDSERMTLEEVTETVKALEVLARQIENGDKHEMTVKAFYTLHGILGEYLDTVGKVYP